jgi:hypothetical protein
VSPLRQELNTQLEVCVVCIMQCPTAGRVTVIRLCAVILRILSPLSYSTHTAYLRQIDRPSTAQNDTDKVRHTGGSAAQVLTRLQYDACRNGRLDVMRCAGSYAMDVDGVGRTLEMRQMVAALHSIGLRVVLDVVYNHTFHSGTHPATAGRKIATPMWRPTCQRRVCTVAWYILCISCRAHHGHGPQGRASHGSSCGVFRLSRYERAVIITVWTQGGRCSILIASAAIDL